MRHIAGFCQKVARSFKMVNFFLNLINADQEIVQSEHARPFARE